MERKRQTDGLDFIGWLFLTLGLGLLPLGGCSDDGPLSGLAPSPGETGTDSFIEDDFDRAAEKSITIVDQDGSIVPAEQVTVDCFGQDLNFYPYTASQLDEDAMDPVNLIFRGEVDPVQIRSALLALDGDRSAYGFPAAYPFDQIWTDAVGGDVQTAWVEGEGWVGSVIQLTLGDYEPIRFHLRLFRTCQEGLTLGGAHFELMIPGTADHQVLHWELAEQIVTADLMRSGLLDPAAPLMPTGLIHQAEGFREIPAEIYNLLPPELYTLIGPVPPVDNPVPIPTDGAGTILNVAEAAPLISGSVERSVTITYDQYVPKPFCSTGPYDWLYLNGPVDFVATVHVDEQGNYSYRSSYDGALYAQPIDMQNGEPVGPPFTALVGGRQGGAIGAGEAQVMAQIKRLAGQSRGMQMLWYGLRVREGGAKRYRSFVRCLDAEELRVFQ